MCDRKGPLYPGREGMDQFKSAHAVPTEAAHAEGSAGRCRRVPRPVGGGRAQARDGRRPWRQARSSSPWPIRTPKSRRRCQGGAPDAIIATGRSDYPNQVNNVLGFPFIFRGALDVRATGINEEMKIAAAQALAELARAAVPEEVAAAYGGISHSFGPEYIIPAPFDPRLIESCRRRSPVRRWTPALQSAPSRTWRLIA
jgi:malate dehydrogenase (oxaloacetate-decarboxylating)(NADP+)